MHTYISIYIHTYISIYIHTYLYTYVRTSITYKTVSHCSYILYNFYCASTAPFSFYKSYISLV